MRALACLAAVWVVVISAHSVAAFSLSPFVKSAVLLEVSLSEALASDLSIHRAAVVVLARGSAKPARRSDGQALAAFSPRAAAAVPLAVRQALASTLLQLEALRGGQPLFPLTVDALDDPTGPQELSGAAPWAVLDLASGRLLLQPRLLELLASPPAEAAALLSSACISSLRKLAQLPQQVLPSSLQVLLNTVLVKAVAAGVVAAVVPRWFCFVCPIVLGLLAPLVINAGVGEAAAEACRVLQLPDDECVDLWWVAVGEGKTHPCVDRMGWLRWPLAWSCRSCLPSLSSGCAGCMSAHTQATPQHQPSSPSADATARRLSDATPECGLWCSAYDGQTTCTP